MKDWQNNKISQNNKSAKGKMIHSEEKRDTKCLKEVRDSLILRQSEAGGEIKKTLVHSK